MSEGKVVVRMAPSPTGYFHIGTVRTALFNYLFARKHGGKFIFRSEDTNDERSKKEYEDNIIDSLKWLGLEYDDFMRQSDRTEVYVSYLKKMLDNGSAYISKEEPKEEGQRSEVIRFKNPNKKISFDDLVRGRVEFDTTDLGDFVVAKSLEEPLYHLAVVVDDHDMKVTHIIRGEDILSSTPRQILIQEAIGAKRPLYAHIPLILAPDRSKLSKRYGATSLTEFKEKGYLPEAILNYMALLGWNPGTDQEIFTKPELIEQFDLSKIQKGGAIFDEKKLRWVNKEHIKRLPKEVLEKVISDKIRNSFPEHAVPEGLADLVAERIEVFADIDELIKAGELGYYFSQPELEVGKIAWKNTSQEETIAHLEKVRELIENDGDIMAYATEAGKGSVLWPMRYALSGKEKSPDPFTLLKVLGKEESLKRLSAAVESLK